MNVMDLEANPQGEEEALVRQTGGTGVVKVETCPPVRSLDSSDGPTTSATDYSIGNPIQFGAAEYSGKPIRSLCKSDEDKILSKKLEPAVPPLPLTVTAEYLRQLPKNSLVIEIGNLLSSDLTNGSYGHFVERGRVGVLPKTIKAGAHEVFTLPSDLVKRYTVLFSFQVTDNLKIVVWCDFNARLVVALAPTRLPLAHLEDIFYGESATDADSNPGNENERTEKANKVKWAKLEQLMWNSTSDHGRVQVCKGNSNGIAIARSQGVLAGVRMTKSGSSVLQVGIVNDIEWNPVPCAASPAKRPRQMEPAEVWSAEDVHTYFVPLSPSMSSTQQTARKSMTQYRGEKILGREMTMDEIMTEKLSYYGYVLEIDNYLDVDLQSGYHYVENDAKMKFVPHTVYAENGDICIIKAEKSGKWSGGVVTYRIGETDIQLAIAFQLCNSSNIFAAAFIPIMTPDSILMDFLTSGAFWATSPDRKYEQAKNGGMVIQVRNIRAKVTMTNDSKALITVEIKTF